MLCGTETTGRLQRLGIEHGVERAAQLLSCPRLDDACRDLPAGLTVGLPGAQALVVHRLDRDMQVDAVDQRPGQLRQVTTQLRVAATAATAPVARLP